MARRYCGMCDKWVPAREKECKACGADTEPAAKKPPKAMDLMDALRRALPHTCHDMNPPHPSPCAACYYERRNYERGRP